jgi:hypothetical protein
MAGWHANAETWTILRADEAEGPETVRDVAAFLRALGALADRPKCPRAPCA